MPRLFIAIQVPKNIQTELVKIQPLKMDGIRLTPPDEMHLTLHFIGEVFDSISDAIRSQLNSISLGAFPLQLDGVGCFRDNGTLRFLWCGVKISTELIRLRDEIGGVLTNLGVRLEDREYKPHITLARLNSYPIEITETFFGLHKAFMTNFDVASFVLYSVERTGREFEYVKLNEYDLTPSSR